MVFSAKDSGRNVQVSDVNGNVKEKLSRNADVSLWNGEGSGEQFEGDINIPQIGFRGKAPLLLREHGLRVSIGGSCLLTW